jgi:hypothetical protein
MDQLPILARLMGLAVICVAPAIYSIIVIERDRSGALSDEREVLTPVRHPQQTAHTPTQAQPVSAQRTNAPTASTTA